VTGIRPYLQGFVGDRPWFLHWNRARLALFGLGSGDDHWLDMHQGVRREGVSPQAQTRNPKKYRYFNETAGIGLSYNTGLKILRLTDDDTTVTV